MKKVLIIFSLVTFLTVIVSTSFTFADYSLITDVSWPNCGQKLPDLTELGIVGVNGGLDYSHNHCLLSEALLFHNQYGLYLNTGYPGRAYGKKHNNYPLRCKSTNDLCLAYDYGYNDAIYSLKYADFQDVHSFIWWLDVETENSWTNNYKLNRESLVGMVAALKQNTIFPTIGFYSYPGQWQLITNKWQNGFPSWIATATNTEQFAKRHCINSFNDGQVWLAQYTTRLDLSYNCLPSIINNLKI